jgi:hypothetical protein
MSVVLKTPLFVPRAPTTGTRPVITSMAAISGLTSYLRRARDGGSNSSEFQPVTGARSAHPHALGRTQPGEWLLTA